jgi:hypothetical protein
VLIDNGSISSLKATSIIRLTGTAGAVSVGDVTVTVGAMVSATRPVVKVKKKSLAIGLPARSLTPALIPPLIVAVYLVLNFRGPEGVNVADVPTGVTVPGTLIPLTVSFMVKDEELIVDGSISSLKAALTFRLIGTSMAVLVGDVTLTVGATLSAAAPVVKVNSKSLAIGLPARSLTPPLIPPLIVAVYLVLILRRFKGVKVADVPAGVTVPGTLIPLTVSFRVKDDELIVAGFISSLKATLTFRLIGTLLAVLVGDVTLTAGAIVSGIVGITSSFLAHPATNVTSSNTRNHIFENTLHLFIVVSSLRTFKSVKLI